MRLPEFSIDALDATKKLEKAKNKVHKLEEEVRYHLVHNRPPDMKKFIEDSQKIIDEQEALRYGGES